MLSIELSYFLFYFFSSSSSDDIRTTYFVENYDAVLKHSAAASFLSSDQVLVGGNETALCF
jgi:hypothetical protein